MAPVSKHEGAASLWPSFERRRCRAAPQSLTQNDTRHFSPCEAAREQADACHHDPRLGAGDACLEILGKATVASEPSEGAFDDPSSRLWLEGPEGLGAGDDLDRPPAQLGDCVQQLWSAIDAIGEDVAQFGEHSSDGPQQWHRTVIILDIGGLDEDGE